MSETKYDLLYGGGYAIKDYYMESGNPRQMRGASELLLECSEAVKELLKSEHGVKEEDIIASGASLSAKVPFGKGAEIAKKAEEIYRKKCQTASVAFVAYPLDESAYKVSKCCAVAEYEKRRAAKFITWQAQDSDDEAFRKANPEVVSSITELKRCPRCRLRTPRYLITNKYNKEKQHLCTSCAKREMKSRERKYLQRVEIKQGLKFDTGYEISNISKLSEDGRVALLYADINGLGAAGKKMATFEDDRDFHEKIQSTVERSVHKAIHKAMNLVEVNKNPSDDLKAQFEIIALAGDDICLLLPGTVALLVAKTIVEEFDHIVSEEFKDKLTISVAACVTNATAAVSYMEDIVARLLSGAKKYANCTSSSVINLSFYEKPGLFPMTAEEIKEFTELLNKSSKVSSTALRNMSEARREMKIDDEFELYFKYYISRGVRIIEDSRAVMEEIYDTYARERGNPWPDFVIWQNQKLGGEETGDGADDRTNDRTNTYGQAENND